MNSAFNYLNLRHKRHKRPKGTQPQPPVNNDRLIDDNDYNDGFGNFYTATQKFMVVTNGLGNHTRQLLIIHF